MGSIIQRDDTPELDEVRQKLFEILKLHHVRYPFDALHVEVWRQVFVFAYGREPTGPEDAAWDNLLEPQGFNLFAEATNYFHHR
jgi:hypothetical protein